MPPPSAVRRNREKPGMPQRTTGPQFPLLVTFCPISADGCETKWRFPRSTPRKLVIGDVQWDAGEMQSTGRCLQVYKCTGVPRRLDHRQEPRGPHLQAARGFTTEKLRQHTVNEEGAEEGGLSRCSLCRCVVAVRSSHTNLRRYSFQPL